MGYQRKTYRLTWPDGHELHGLEVVMRGASVDDMTLAMSLANSDESAREEAARVVPELLARKMVSWNYEDEDGTPIGTDAVTLAGQDMRVLTQIINAWQSVVTSVPPPLPGNSNSGERFPEVTIPMDVSSLAP